MTNQHKPKTDADAINAHLESASQRTLTSVEVAREMLGPKEETSVTFHRKPAEPVRAESPRRWHNFYSAEGLVEYLKKYKSENTVVLADTKAEVVKAVIDDKAKRGFEKICFLPSLHPAFEPWDAISGDTMELNDLVQFLLLNRRIVVQPDSRELLATLSQVKISENTTVRRGLGPRAANGVMCEVTIQGEKRAEPIDLPEVIAVESPVFVSTATKRIEFDLVLNAKAGKIYATIASADLKQIKTEIFEEAVAVIREAKVGIVQLGQVAHVPWQYIDSDED